MVGLGVLFAQTWYADIRGLTARGQGYLQVYVFTGDPLLSLVSSAHPDFSGLTHNVDEC